MPRIEVRVVGTRALATSALPRAALSPGSGQERSGRLGNSSLASTQSYRTPSLRLSALWNGDQAASVNLSTCEGDSLTMPRPPGWTAGDEGGGDNFGGGGFGFGSSNDVHVGSRAAETPRLIVLPLYVPCIMKGCEKGDLLCAGCATNSRCFGVHSGHRDSSSCCGRVDGVLGGGGGAGSCFGTENGHRGDEGGRSHCLQVRIDINHGASKSDRTHCKTFGNERCGSNEGAMMSSSSQPSALPRHTEVCLFERDLMRSEWTEVLVPVCTEEVERNVRPREQRHRAKGTQPDVAVVLQVRSAGFTPEKAPLWLLRRDFAERAVGRIMSAAAAALVQPRVEITLLGLCGAVDSLLSERAGEEKGGNIDVLSKPAGSLLPATLAENKSDGGCDEVLCEAFWNGTLVHQVCLHRAVPFAFPATDDKMAALPCSSWREETSAIRSGDLESGQEKDKEQQVEGAVVDLTGARPAHPRDSNPSAWFSGGGGGDDDHLDGDWVTLSGGELPPQNDAAKRWEASGKQQPATPKPDNKSLHEGETTCKHSGHLSEATEADDDPRGKNSTRQPLMWVPAEDDVFRDRAFRFFLPACLVDDAAGGQTEGLHPEESNARSGQNGGIGVGGEIMDGSSGNGDAGDPRDSIRGDWRLVFWAVSPPSSSAQERNILHVASGEDGTTTMTVGQKAVDEGGRVRAAAVARRRNTGRRFLGCAGLTDDELLLQPRGHRIELALSAETGLDVPTAWSMSHDLKRYATRREWRNSGHR